jgi:hypothetical protein
LSPGTVSARSPTTDSNPEGQPLEPFAHGIKAAFDCVKAFSETDLTEDLKKIDVPTDPAQ